jgi:hypothetical protein
MDQLRIIELRGQVYKKGGYPFDELAIGEWFFVPSRRASAPTVKEMVRRRNRKDRGFFECRTVDGGTEVSRIDETNIIR